MGFFDGQIVSIQGNGVTVMDPYTESLASLPQIPRKRTAGDGTEPGGGQPATPGSGAAPTAVSSPDAQPSQPSAPSRPTLEHADPQQQFRTVDQLTRTQDRLRRNRYAIDLYHTWLDGNVQFGRLDKVPNQSVWIAKLAPGISAERGAAVPNKAADLCNKVTDALLSDPPKPNPRQRNSESGEAASDLVAEVLRQIGGESGYNEVQQYRWALRNALTRSTSFLEYDIDRTGGGYQPLQVMAHPEATDPSQPLMAQDPMTGAPIPAVNPILRYVSAGTPDAPSGQFVQDASQADRVWLPKLLIRKHHRTKVVLMPADAAIEEADAAILTDWCTIDQGMKRWPDTVGQMDASALAGLASWRPSYADMVVPFAFRGGMAEGMTGPSVDDVGTFSPLLQRRMFFHRLWIRKTPEYPSGYALDISGVNGGTVLTEGTLDYTVHLPTDGTTTRCRDIPLVQVTPIQDVTDLDPMGWPFEARFDGSAQADAMLISEYLDALSRMANPHVFIRSTTAVDEDEWSNRSVPIILGPQDQEPTYEKFGPLPPVVEVSQHLQTREDTASGLTATAQGLDSENSQSGIAKKLTVRQAQISLAGIQQQLHAAFTRGWRIASQYIQAEFSTPQLAQMTGEDLSNEAQWWTGEDFAGIDDIGIEPGSGTMMTAEDKANYVSFLQSQAWITPQRAAEIGITGIARDLGLSPDPTTAAIERSVGVWLKGVPSPNWIQEYQAWKAAEDQYQQTLAQYTQQQQAQQQYFLAKATMMAGPPSGMLGPEGQAEKAGTDYQSAVIAVQMATMQNPGINLDEPLQPPQPNQVPKPWTPFETRPNDTEPTVAEKWTQRLSLLQMSPQYDAQPKEWRDVADQKYTTARQAVAIAGASGGLPTHGGSRPPARHPTNPGAASGTSMGPSQVAA